MTEDMNGVSKVKVALGAASLFLFLVGVKRSFRRDDGSEILSNGELGQAASAATTEEPLRQLRNAS